MSKKYNPDMPSERYDEADLAALKASNIPPALVGLRQCRFDDAEDALQRLVEREEAEQEVEEVRSVHSHGSGFTISHQLLCRPISCCAVHVIQSWRINGILQAARVRAS